MENLNWRAQDNQGIFSPYSNGKVDENSDNNISVQFAK